MEADQLRLCAGGRLGGGGVREAVGGCLGRALAVGRVWGGCEGCAGRERIRCDELGVLQLEASQTAAHNPKRSPYAVNAYALALDADDDFCALPLLDSTDAAHTSRMYAPVGRADGL